jgi:hypothetical protein
MTGALYFINDPTDLPISSNVIKYVHLYPYSGHGNSGHTPTPLPAYNWGGVFINPGKISIGVFCLVG